MSLRKVSYKEQLHYTNIAIKWINGLQISKKGQIKNTSIIRKIGMWALLSSC